MPNCTSRGVAKEFPIAFGLFACILLSGCAWPSASPNTPYSYSFPAIADRPAEGRVFLDANGSFYPSGWQHNIGEQRIRRSGSLLAAATDAERHWIETDEQRQLQELAALIRGKKRVFVFTHGFNIDEADSGFAFDLIERRIAFKPSDAVIRVHWDGMTGTGAGVGAIWFPAAGYSQVVGLRGLRRILRLAAEQQLVLISHSRGALVLLSAVADPPFDPGFRQATVKLFGPDFLSSPQLPDTGGRIDVFMLAPAVGFPDFWNTDCEIRPRGDGCADPPALQNGNVIAEPCRDYRRFTPRLRSVQYTLNAGDDTLRKKAFNLRRHFNSTDLGYDEAVGRRLANCYGNLTATRIARPHKHAFRLYAQDPELAAMLARIGVSVR